MESVWSLSKLSTESVGSRRELVANCVHTAHADATKQFRRVGVSGVYWALANEGPWARARWGTNFLPSLPSPSLSSLSFPLHSPIPFSHFLSPSPSPPSLLLSPFPFSPVPSLIPSPSRAVSSPSGSGRSPAAKRFLVHLELKRALPEMAVYIEIFCETTCS